MQPRHSVRTRTREVTIVAHDPSVRDAEGNILRESIIIPDEELIDGPTGYRVSVIDFDASTESYYKPWPLRRNASKSDPYGRARDRQILGDPGFHCHNVYALVMRTLARFEQALGRRIAWGFLRPSAQDRTTRFRRRERVLFGARSGVDVRLLSEERRQNARLHLSVARRHRP